MLTRYGKRLEVAAAFDPPGDPPTYELELLLDILSIRSGELSLDLSRGGAWLERLRSSLLSRGLDKKHPL